MCWYNAQGAMADSQPVSSFGRNSLLTNSGLGSQEGTDPKMNAVTTSSSEHEALQDALLSRATKLRNAIERKIPARLRAVISPDDILQEVWISAFGRRSAPRVEDIESFDAWLMAIADRRLVEAMRSLTRAKRGGRGGVIRNADLRAKSFIDLFELAAAKTATPSSEAAVSEAVTVVRIALADMPDSNRQALIHYYIEGRSREQVADLMGRTRGTVNCLLFRGLQLLKHRMGHANRFFSDAPSDDGPEPA
jgi:RNA polymerase sigma factor (sigma-70 family)